VALQVPGAGCLSGSGPGSGNEFARFARACLFRIGDGIAAIFAVFRFSVWLAMPITCEVAAEIERTRIRDFPYPLYSNILIL